MAIWYIAINGQQQGPLELDQLLLTVREKGAGNVHVYREGFTGWKLASEVADVTRRLKLLPPLATAEPAPSVQPAAPPESLPSSSVPSPSSVPSAGQSPSNPIASNHVPRRSTAPAASGGNFIARHWRGELPLWMSYWIVTILGHFFMLGVQGGILGQIGEHPAIAIAAPVAFGVSAVVEVWQMVGLWRSAVVYKMMRRTEGRSVFWGLVVQVLMVLWIAIWIGGAMLFLAGMMERNA